MVNLLQNMNLATENDLLNLAGVLLFGQHPEWVKPQFIVKGICFPGNEVSTSTYIDSEGFFGPLQKVFTDALAFVLRNLKKIKIIKMLILLEGRKSQRCNEFAF